MGALAAVKVGSGLVAGSLLKNSGLFGGKSSAPPPPQPTQPQGGGFDGYNRAAVDAARITAQGNLDAAKYATAANRANQYNPYGSLIWERGATDMDPWTQRQTFTAEGQKLFDLQNQQDMAYAQAASKGFEATRGMFENPNIDTSGMPSLRGIDMSKVSGIRGLNIDGLPQTALQPGQIAQDALLSRINPSLMADEESLRSRLANQGIGLGSAAYNREMGLQGQRATDLRLQAAAQGIGIDQAARQQAFGERQAMSGFDMGLNAQQFGQQEALSNQAARQRAQMMEEAYAAQSRPLDLINSLRSGSQVKNPQFASYANQATTAGPDMMGAYNSAVQQGQFGQNLAMQQQQFQQGLQQNQQNAKRASNDALIGGLFSLGGAMLSDRRLKTNIKPVGKTDGGLTVYTYNYIWGGPTQMGVMAQDVEEKDPSAVVKIDGFKAVDYSKVQ